MNKPSTIRQLMILLARTPLQRVKNHARDQKTDDLLKHLVLLFFGVAVIWAEYRLFARFWEVLTQQPMGFAVILPKMISFVGSFLFAFLSYSSIMTALSLLYRSEDMALLLVSPTPKWIILLYKWFEVGVRSGFAFFMLAIPPVVALANSVPLRPVFFFAYGSAILSLSAVSVSIGVCAAMLLMLVFPEKRLYQSVAIVGLCLAALMITGLRFLNLETLWSENPGDSPLLNYFREENSDLLRYAPAMFLSHSILPFLWGNQGGWSWLGGGMAVGALSIFMTLLLGGKIFLTGWRKSEEQNDPSIKPVFRAEKSLFQLPLPAAFRAMMRKDWVILRRDPTIWTQLFMMLPLSAMYILNLTFLPLQVQELTLFFTVSNVALIGLIVSAISARFLYPAASREGRSVWITASSPLSSTQYLMQKILFSCPPVITVSLILLFVSTAMLNLPNELYLWSICYGVLLSMQLCILAVSLGFCFPVFNYKNLMEVSLGKGAILYMLLALTQTGSLAYAALRDAFNDPALSLSVSGSSLRLWLLVWLVITWFCFWIGKRKTESIEFHV